MTSHDVQALWRDIMNQATLALWTQRNVALSWPIPAPEGAAQLHLFTYTSTQPQPGIQRIGRPDLRITWHSEFSLAMMAGKGFPGISAIFPAEHAAPWKDPIAAPFMLEELTSLYNAALAFYPHHTPPQVFLDRLRMLWEQYIPACLIPYHEALNPDFFAWMRQQH